MRGTKRENENVTYTKGDLENVLTYREEYREEKTNKTVLQTISE